MQHAYETELNFAIEAVKTAAQLCRRIQEEMILPAVTKEDSSPVTVADFASQAIVAKMHRETFPDVPLVAEEDSSVLRGPDGAGTLSSVHRYVQSLYPEVNSETVCDWIDLGAGETEDRFWTLDPIDGTKGFLRRDQYVVALALIERGQVLVGAMGCPNLNQDMQPDHGGNGSIAYAVKGQDAWAMDMSGGEPKRIYVSGRDDPHEARMLRSFETSHTDPGKINQIAHEMGMEADPVLMDSQAKYGLLAAGNGELIFRLLSPSQPGYQEKIWDQAAGSILVEEAGGKVTDLMGARLDFAQGRTLQNNIGVLASNGHLHDHALNAIKIIGADRRPEGE
jgi:3'(2'), 5'-bisphosphate nucleotidase